MAASAGVSALILAAGASRRLGEPKQLVRWRGAPLLETVVGQTLKWPVQSVWVVLGYRIDEILAAVEFGPAGIIENPEWEEGMASSMRVGLDTLSRDSSVQAAFVVMGDQPNIDPLVVDALLDRYGEADGLAVVPKYRYIRGNPALIGRPLWSRLMSLEGDQGARKLLQAHPDWVTEVWFEQLPPRDVDTLADLEDLHP